MSEVEITIQNGGVMDDEYLKLSANGPLAAALRNCILRIGDRYAGDPAVQRLAEAVAGVDVRTGK